MSTDKLTPVRKRTNARFTIILKTLREQILCSIQKAMRERWEKITSTSKKLVPPSFENQLKEARNVLNNLQKLMENFEQRP